MPGRPSRRHAFPRPRRVAASVGGAWNERAGAGGRRRGRDPRCPRDAADVRARHRAARTADPAAAGCRCAGGGRRPDAPGSRRNPDAGRAALADWLPEAGIGYRWDRRLGGFRRAAPDSPDVFWENPSFRGYAGYSRHPDFLAAMDELLARARAARTAVMCAEAVWWRCHRRIIADFAVLVRGARVLHLAHDGRLTEHAPTSGARLRDDGLLVYDRV
ncbi:DUF488 family protein [Microbispora sp. GKU 823]|uniref:DUF488 domain-containing protein n=1 Tax=Microbispora sp. GKU 823 TaxID=1652100 RepID=UPI00277B50A8|nr:DUF488 domain-containing protein [Microbispora sp. GKU 823]